MTLRYGNRPPAPRRMWRRASDLLFQALCRCGSFLITVHISRLASASHRWSFSRSFCMSSSWIFSSSICNSSSSVLSSAWFNRATRSILCSAKLFISLGARSSCIFSSPSWPVAGSGIFFHSSYRHPYRMATVFELPFQDRGVQITQQPPVHGYAYLVHIPFFHPIKDGMIGIYIFPCSF